MSTSSVAASSELTMAFATASAFAAVAVLGCGALKDTEELGWAFESNSTESDAVERSNADSSIAEAIPPHSIKQELAESKPKFGIFVNSAR
eukprot:SAG11_NODE_2031_length_3901_cov_3.995792_1_plen_91_part_00